MVGGASEPVPAPVGPAPERAVVRMSGWQSLLVAFGSLLLVSGLGCGVMLAGGVILHALAPERHINIFAALHNHWVVGVLLGLVLLWLLPPHPWAKRAIATVPEEQPAPAGGTELAAR